MGKKYYCAECNKDYEFIPITKKESFHVDAEEDMEFDVEELCCPVCECGYFINPTVNEITDTIAKRRREKMLK